MVLPRFGVRNSQSPAEEGEARARTSQRDVPTLGGGLKTMDDVPGWFGRGGLIVSFPLILTFSLGEKEQPLGACLKSVG